ncbi:hypothetical protein TWF694_000527 [Orbilia ellipsospora]|uniref:Vps72/YL1 C-terminal domain-containing protein n=1 Tax=Orbilia ellipsospora TaxID=2528407 RepID=A0AAV9XPQ7_9PEZI
MSANEEMDIDVKSDNASSREPTPQLPETLIAGRQRRSTAGNRLAQLLLQEQPDDIDLLFEENGEDDADFVGKEESDVDLGSSSDEEDKPQEQDELAGEKELQREERSSKRRKGASTFPGQKEMDKLVQRQQSLREKRVKIQEPQQERAGSSQPPTEGENTPRARKKSERLSWIPTMEDRPSRQSSRRQTVANKKMIHERMKESNERRLKVIAAMNEASQRKKNQKVELTQEMRLERAKKVEEKNKRSLNKWQVAEEARLEAQRAKLAALHNRKMEGPYIRFYSGRAERDADGRLIKLGRRNLIEEIPDKTEQQSDEKNTQQQPEDRPEGEGQKDSETLPQQIDQPKAAEDVVMTDAPRDVDIQEKVALDEDGALASEVQVDGESSSHQAPVSQEQPSEPATAPSIPEISAVPPSDADVSDDTPHQIAEQLQGDLDASLRPVKPRVTSQTFISLRGFENEKLGKDFRGKVLFPHNRGPLPKPDRPLCVTTSLPARFIDPSTGLPYASLFGYKQIQRVKLGGLQWNNRLQCFFDGQEAAAGVPEGFYD